MKPAHGSKQVTGQKRPVTSGQTSLSSSHTTLEVQSSPMQLATRSLSARTLTNPAQSADSAQKSTRSSSSTNSASHRKAKSSAVGSRRRTASGRGVEPLQLPVERGFNVAEHLRNSADNDRLRQSASSDVHKLLQDISSVMRSVSPSLEPTRSPMSAVSGRGGDGKATTNPPNLAGRRAHLRSKVAANFNLPEEHGQQGVWPDRPLPPALEDGVELVRKAPNNRGVSHSRPRVPHLNIGGTSNNAPPNGTATAPSNIGNIGGPSKSSKEAEGTIQNLNGSKGHHGLDAEGVIHQPALVISTEPERRAASQAVEVRSLLEEKRAGLSRSRLEELERAQSEVEAMERKRLDREQRRAAKLKADRMAAIAELKKRREEKRVLQEKLAQEEMVRHGYGAEGQGLQF